MFQRDLLHHGAYFGLLDPRSLSFQKSIEPGPAYSAQLAHPFHTEIALQLHYFPDLVVNAAPPLCVGFGRRASIFRKAPLKKSTSMVLSAKASFSLVFSTRKAVSRASAASC